MVADKIDMSLDDIIATNRRGRGGRGGRGARGGRGSFRGGRGGPRGRSQNFRSGGGPITRRGGRGFNQNRTSPYSRPRSIPDKWEHDKYDGPGRGGSGPGRRTGDGVSTGAHLQIANLDFGVTESDIKELFSEFGKLKKAIINYDGSGRSHGTADVVFERKADASKAVKTYNGVPLDGRPMKIEVVSGQISFEQQQNNNSTPMRRRLSGGNTRGGNNSYNSRGRGRGDRGFRGGRGRGNRGGRREQRDVPSKDELDRELDSYVVKGNL